MDVRWKQRFNNYKKALLQLSRFMKEKELNEMERQGLIKSFEYTYELGWKTLQDLIKFKGFEDVIGPKPVIEQSFQMGLIENGEGWVKMHTARNMTSHTYNEETAIEIVGKIKKEFFDLLLNLKEKLEKEEGVTQQLFK